MITVIIIITIIVSYVDSSSLLSVRKKRPAEVRDKREQLVLCANTTCIICSAVFFS